MKIDRLHVRGFGKIENFNLELSKGLNVIYGPNESGKSTIMAFIKAMFFGLKGGRAGSDGTASESKRYMPWGGSQYGGFVNFTLDNGNFYRIDRSFDKGIIKLYDEALNDITGRFDAGRDGSGIAEKLLGINAGLFERTVFIKQMGTRIDTSASKDLIDRISNIRQSGSEDISYKNASRALRDALKQQVGTDRSYTRPLDIINRRLEELNEAKSRYQHEYKHLLDTQKEKDDLDIQIVRLSQKERLFSKAVEFCNLRKKDDEIRFLNDGVRQCQNNINKMTHERSLLEKELENNVSEKEHRKTSKTGKADKPRNTRALDLGMIFSLIALLAVIFGVAFLNIAAPFITAIPSLSLIVFGILRLRAGRKPYMAKAETELGDNDSKLQRMNAVLEQQIAGISERMQTEVNQNEQLVKRLEAYPAGLDNKLDKISEDISELMESLAPYLTAAEIEQVKFVMEKPDESQYSKICRLKEFITDELQQKKLRKAILDQELNAGKSGYDEHAVEAEIIKLTQQKVSLIQRGEALNIAIKTLEEASNDIQKKYLPVMNKVIGKTFSELTSNKYEHISPGDNLNIMLSDPFTQTIVPAGVLSSGTIDQLYLALRIAISETVLKMNESLTFIMDEPFAQYDDFRIDNALKSIYDISKKQQVLIFTCKQREVDVIEAKFPCKICSLT